MHCLFTFHDTKKSNFVELTHAAVANTITMSRLEF